MQASALTGDSSTRPAASVVAHEYRRRARRRRAGRRPAPRSVAPACPACASPIRGKASACPHCGAYIDSEARRQMAEGRRLVRRYQLGMKVMGVALTILGSVSLLVGMLLAFLLATLFSPFDGGSLLIVLAVMAVLALLFGIPLWLGICAFKFHGWVNWAVAFYYGLTLLGTSLLTVNSGHLEISFGALVGAVMFAVAVVNIINRNRIRQMGLNPKYGAVLNRSRRPRARQRR
ncbi:MAG: zinc ribbon domain-containing protein [Planctomycetota bacterium]|jgi:hypothetical protein